MSSLVLFTINNKVVSTESGKLYVSTIEKLKKEIAKEYQVTTDDIELVVFGSGILKDVQELSKYDNSIEGISLWDAEYPSIVNGVKFNGDLDLFLKIMNNENTYSDYINYIDELELVKL